MRFTSMIHNSEALPSALAPDDGPHASGLPSALIAIGLLTMAIGLTSSPAGADELAPPQPAASPAPAQSGDQKIDVSDLENRYWSAKDTDFSVVQNRLFTKAKSFAFSADYGVVLNDSWSNDSVYDFNLTYYFTERYGVTLTYDDIDSQDNTATQRLESQSGMPDHNMLKDYYGASFNWVPFYAKMSVLNSHIIYFDMSISPGMGMTTYDQRMYAGDQMKAVPTAALDITQHFFLNKNFALRIDLKNRWYEDDIMTFRPQNNGPYVQTTSNITEISILMFGLTFFFH